jgi:Uma2 family endonuclease
MVVHHKTDVTFDEFEEYIERPENSERLLELINGEIVEKVPTEEHGIVVLNIASPLRAFVRQHKLGRVTTEARHHLPGDDKNDRLPDVSFRSDISAPVVRQGPIAGMPDLAVEVQSPSQSESDMVKKAAYYLANGSRMVWLAYLTKRSVEVHRRSQPVEILEDGDVLDGDDVLPGFTLSLSDVFDLD